MTPAIHATGLSISHKTVRRDGSNPVMAAIKLVTLPLYTVWSFHWSATQICATIGWQLGDDVMLKKTVQLGTAGLLVCRLGENGNTPPICGYPENYTH